MVARYWWALVAAFLLCVGASPQDPSAEAMRNLLDIPGLRKQMQNIADEKDDVKFVYAYEAWLNGLGLELTLEPTAGVVSRNCRAVIHPTDAPQCVMFMWQDTNDDPKTALPSQRVTVPAGPFAIGSGPGGVIRLADESVVSTLDSVALGIDRSRMMLIDLKTGRMRVVRLAP